MHSTKVFSTILAAVSVAVAAPVEQNATVVPRDAQCILAGYSNTHRGLFSCGGTGATLLTCSGDNETGFKLWGKSGNVVAEVDGNAISNKGVNIKASDLKLPQDVHWLAPNDLGLSMDSCYVDYNGGHWQGKPDDAHNPCGKSGITSNAESKTCFSCAVSFPCEAN